ncbi:aldo/keto reductase [Pontibacter silvestris]|uniref:Aldo/keto reductase n=1 Tax=Pontibacter silvestris TaxID=2305183 RepID=A0ABW4WRL3_9BACT|nr:aldo/keto reductase [Pontibacter silvestris]MCC9136146.1 aldo/keto reductase [Pontibacter silvestris]
MKKRQLGNSELEIAPLVFGGNVFGWTINEETSFKLLDAFLDADFNCIDTADVYSRWASGNNGGDSEAIIGKWLKQRSNRDKVIIATKVGSEMGEGMKGLSKSYIKQAVEASLKRLQTDYIDLYQSHYDDPETPVEETLEAYGELIKEGKVRAIGASNFSPERLRESLEASAKSSLPRYETFQPEYNLYDREGYEKDIEPVCNEYGLGVISYFSLASGFLTGKYRSEDDLSKSQRGQAVKKYLDDRGNHILQALDEVAKQHNSTPASVSLAWLMARPSITAPIASATKLEQLDALVKAAELKLDSTAIEKLTKASAY